MLRHTLITSLILCLITMPAFAQEDTESPDLTEYDADTLRVLVTNLYKRVEALELELEESRAAVAEVAKLRRENAQLQKQINERSVATTASEPPESEVKAQAAGFRGNGFTIGNLGFSVGDVDVKVTSVAVDKVPLEGITGRGRSQSELFTVTLELTNKNENRMVRFKTWAGDDFGLDRSLATLEDNHGNTYRRVNFGIGNEVIGRFDDGRIRPGQTVTDVLVFENPVGTAESFTLAIPHENLGEDGSTEIKIETNGQ